MRSHNSCIYQLKHTVPALNACTKLAGCLSIVHNRTPDCHSFLGMDACATSRLNVVLFHKLIVCHLCVSLISFIVVYEYFYNQALGDVWSTGTEIKCLHCSFANEAVFFWYVIKGIFSVLVSNMFHASI